MLKYYIIYLVICFNSHIKIILDDNNFILFLFIKFNKINYSLFNLLEFNYMY